MPESVCQQCGESFTTSRADARFCSVTCRVRAKRARDKPTLSTSALGWLPETRAAYEHLASRVPDVLGDLGDLFDRYGPDAAARAVLVAWKCYQLGATVGPQPPDADPARQPQAAAPRPAAKRPPVVLVQVGKNTLYHLRLPEGKHTLCNRRRHLSGSLLHRPGLTYCETCLGKAKPMGLLCLLCADPLASPSTEPGVCEGCHTARQNAQRLAKAHL